MSQNLRKWGKSVKFLICVSNFLRFKFFFIENDTGYKFCVFNYLRFKTDCEKQRKLDHRENYRIYNKYMYTYTGTIRVTTTPVVPPTKTCERVVTL